VSVAQDLKNGETPDLAKAGIGAAGGATGSAVAAKLGTATAAAVSRLSKAGGVSAHVAQTTQSATNFGAKVKVEVSAGEELGKAATDAATAAGGKLTEQKLK
jgi:transcriptional regulator